MRATLSAPASTAALLQQWMPGGCAAMVAAEGPRKIPGDASGQRKTERAKRALSGARQRPKDTRKGSSWRAREGHHYRRFFSMAAATGRAATRASCASGEARCNGSARILAGVRWSASGNGNGDGRTPAPAEPMPARGHERSGAARSSRHIALPPAFAYLHVFPCNWSFTNWIGVGIICGSANHTGSGT